MNKTAYNIVLLIITLFIFQTVQAQNSLPIEIGLAKDTLKTKENKQAERAREKLDLRHSHQRFKIKLDNVYASLDTEVSFQINDGILTASLGLEQNLGLADQKYFFAGSFQYRITPRSGIYAEYYGINRQETNVTDQDYIFMKDTIPAGLNITAFFNTQVISAGYMLSILRDPNAFLGLYFNVYFMMLDTGIKSENYSFNPNFKNSS
jgi:hypothetical protein